MNYRNEVGLPESVVNPYNPPTPDPVVMTPSPSLQVNRKRKYRPLSDLAKNEDSNASTGSTSTAGFSGIPKVSTDNSTKDMVNMRSLAILTTGIGQIILYSLCHVMSYSTIHSIYEFLL